MSRKKKLFAGLGATATLGVLLLAASVGSALPSELPPQDLTQGVSGFQGNITLEAPPKDFAPKISAVLAADEALARADAVEAKSIQSTLASFSWSAVPVDENDKPTGPPLFSNVPVWVVTVEGVCSQLVPDTGECINSKMNFVVDATSDEFIVAYASEQDLVGEPI